MATILMGWELGEGLGHVQPLLQVARALAAQGHRPVFALHNIIDTWPLLRGEGFAILQAPIWHRRTWRGERPFLASGYADVLAIRGWDRVDHLAPQVEGWQRLLDFVQPALIVCDYSPTLGLAAFRTHHVIHLGSWFCMPPVDGPTFPLLLPGQPPLMPQDQILAVAQTVQMQRSKPTPPTLPSILAAGDCFPLVLPEVDPYRQLRKTPSSDPLEVLPAPLPPPAAPGFFAYLSAENQHVEAILTKMALTGCPGTVYLRSAPADLKERLRLQGLTVLDEPVPLTEVLKKAAVVLHHGGMGTTNIALSCGRPQILLPQHLEQVTTSQVLHRMGVGFALAGNFTPDSAARVLRQMLGERRFTEQAQACAHALQSRPRRDALAAILERSAHHLAAGRG